MMPVNITIIGISDEIRDVHRFSITNDQIDEWKREARNHCRTHPAINLTAPFVTQ
jgi:hypothetical protein